MRQGVLTHVRGRLPLSKGHSCCRPRRTGERSCRSVRGGTVDANRSVLNVVIVKEERFLVSLVLLRLVTWGPTELGEPADVSISLKLFANVL